MGILSILAESEKMKAHIDDTSGIHKLEEKLAEKFRMTKHRSAIILCIGTDRSTGDALGPLIGTRLSRFGLSRVHILGTLDQPVHATNLNETMTYIQKSFVNPYIIAVDACLGRLDSVGFVTLSDGPLKPGAGVHKDLPEVGDLHLTGIVNVGGFMEYMVLQNTRLNLVWHMSESISNIFSRAYLQSFA